MILKINKEYEVEAETEDEALAELEERFGRENNNAENEFWREIEVVENALSEEEIDELGLNFEDFKYEKGKICKNHKYRYFKAVYELKEVKEITENDEE